MIYDTPRLRAKAAGLTRYEGLPCINCGGTTRFVSSQACVPCKQAKKYAARKRKQKHEKRGRPAKEKIKLTPEQELEKRIAKREYDRIYRNRPERQGYKREKKAKYRCAKLNRTPIWLTKHDKKLIKAVYNRAVQVSIETGIMHHVDHIIPLQGKLVSGLHVPSNLQVIPAAENLQKLAKYEV